MTEKTIKRPEQLEASVGNTGPVINIRIVFVSPDGTETTPKTMEELRELELERERRKKS